MEARDAVGRDAAIGQIAARRLRLGRFQQALVKLFFRPAHGGEQGLFFIGSLGRSAGMRRKRNARALGEHLQGFAKLDAFDLHQEGEDVAADIRTDPALEALPLGIDLQAGFRVVVPGTESLVAAAFAPQGDVLCTRSTMSTARLICSLVS